MGTPLQLHPAMMNQGSVYRIAGKSIKHPKMSVREWRIRCPKCGIKSGGVTKTQTVFDCPIRDCGYSAPIEDKRL